MKVYISNYRDHWISPYTMLDYIFFWTDWSKCSRNWTLKDTLEDDADITKGSRSRYVERPGWCEKWADRLMPISQAIQWVGQKVWPRVEYVKIDRWDTWSMDHTLGQIALPMLKQLQATKHGAPNVDDEDVPEELRSTSAPPLTQEQIDNGSSDDNMEKRWEWILDEMIWAFETHIDDDWDSQFYSGEHDIKWEKDEVTGYSKMMKGPNDTWQVNREGLDADRDRRKNGFRLFGKYYLSLWD